MNGIGSVSVGVTEAIVETVLGVLVVVVILAVRAILLRRGNRADHVRD